MTLDLFCQIWVSVVGLVAIWLCRFDRREIRRWAPVLGLLAQPAWFTTSIINDLWGVLILSCLYTLTWLEMLVKLWRGK